MDKYALFFDIDGTLVSFETHQIPPSTILALTQAKANGHKVFIATGRPPIIITNLGAIEHLIDGYVTTNGALCFIGEQTVSCHAIPHLELAKPVEVVLQQRVLQMTPFFPESYEAELMARIPTCTSGRWHPEFTDITAKQADKGQGLLAIAKEAGLDPKFTMAFRTAGIGVAMGNALESLKQEADYTTTSVDDNGILNALRHFELI